MPDTESQPEPLRIPISHSVRYAVRGLPEVPNQYGHGTLTTSEITLTYRAAEDSQLGRVHAYVAGRLWVDGAEIPLLPGGLYGQHYDDGLDGWPGWLAEEARLHDPDAVVLSVPADRAAIEAAAFKAAANYVRGHSADERYGKASISTALCTVSDELYRWADDASGPSRMADEAHQPETPPAATEAPAVCEGFQWIGQSFATCDRCGQPAWDHAGEEVAVDGAGPFDTRRTVRPWKPGQADAMRAKWAPSATVSQPAKEA